MSTSQKMSGKRTRFGLMFHGTKPPSLDGDFLKELGIVKADGCERDGDHFLVFSTSKPRKSAEVLEAVNSFNAVALEKMALGCFQDGPEVVVFDRGNCFRAHPMCKIIQAAAEKDAAWSWSTMASGEGRKKRAVSELESDLVESSIRPSFLKRMAVRLTEVMVVPCVIGALIFGRGVTLLTKSFQMQTGSDAAQSSSVGEAQSTHALKKKTKKLPYYSQKENVGQGLAKDVVIMLVKEMARSKDETIETKNQLIELLMSRKCSSCTSGSV